MSCDAIKGVFQGESHVLHLRLSLAWYPAGTRLTLAVFAMEFA